MHPSFRLSAVVLSLALTADVALADGPGSCCPPGVPYQYPAAQPGTPGAQGAPGAQAAPGAAQAPATDAFAQAPPSGGEAAASALPNMIGDLFGAVHAYTPAFAINGSQSTFIPRASSIPQGVIGSGTVLTVDVFINGVRVPAGTPLNGAQAAALNNPQLFSRLPAGSSSILPILKIVENESPLPQDRVYATYNYYNDVDRHLNPAPSQENVHRELVGFEKTFLDGNASIGLRLPIFELYGDDFGNRGFAGDLNIILKYAFLHDRECGNALSGGLVITAPTGADLVPTGIGAPNIHPTLFQPFVSAIYKISDNFYAQGFASVVVPDDERDATLIDTDLSVDYIVWRDATGDRILTSIIPTIEAHVTTPVNHRGALSEPVGVSDVVDVTVGSSFGIGCKSFLTLGVAIPVVGPRPFGFETVCMFNWQF